MKISKSLVFKQIVRNYILSLVLPCLLITSIICVKTYAIVYENIQASNLSSVKKLEQELNSIYESFEKLVISLQNWPSVKKLFTMTDNVNSSWVNNEDLYTLVYMLRKQKALEPSVENMAIVFRNIDLVIDCDGYNNTYSDFFQDKYSFDSASFNGAEDIDWEHLTQSVISDCRIGKYSQADQDSILYQCAITNAAGMTKAILLVTIKPGSLTNQLTQYLLSANDTWCVLSKDNELVLSTSVITADEAVRFLGNDRENSKYGYNLLAGKPHVYYYSVSYKNQMTYASFHPISYLLKQFLGLTLFTVLVLFSIIFIGIFFAYHRAKKSYAPIRKLVNLFLPTGTEHSYSVNEYFFIEESVEHMVSENHFLKTNIQQYYPLIKNKLLLELLSCQEFTPAFREKLVRYQINFPYARLVAVALSAELMSKESEESPANLPVLLAVIFSCLNEFFLMDTRKMTCHAVELPGGEYMLLLNMDACEEKILEKVLKDLLSFVYKKLQSEYEAEIYLGISHPSSGEWNFRTAGHQALQALEYRYTDSSGYLLWYDKCAKVSINYNFTFDDEIRLMNLIKSGNTEEALSFVDKVLQDFFAQGRIKREDAAYIFNEILSTCAKVIHETNVRVLDVMDYQKFQSLTQFNQMNDYVMQCIVQCCQVIKDLQEKSENGLSRRIIDYINQYYTNYEMTLTFLADMFHVSPIYISKTVKKTVGISFIDYLNRLRIEYSKKLLKDDTVTIKNIAAATGFDSDKNFIRVFKKYEGITPGQYRKLSPSK